MTNVTTIDPADLALLRRIQQGERRFRQRDDQSYEDYHLEVLRLLQLQKDELINMNPQPKRTSRTKRREFITTGDCELTLKGHQALRTYLP